MSDLCVADADFAVSARGVLISLTQLIFYKYVIAMDACLEAFSSTFFLGKDFISSFFLQFSLLNIQLLAKFAVNLRYLCLLRILRSYTFQLQTFSICCKVELS